MEWKNTFRKLVYISDLVLHEQIEGIIKKEHIRQYTLSELISKRKSFEQISVWLRDDEKPDPGFYKITDPETGSHVKVSHAEYDAIQDPPKKLLIYDYDRSQLSALYIYNSGGELRVSSYSWSKIVCHVAGEREIPMKAAPPRQFRNMFRD